MSEVVDLTFSNKAPCAPIMKCNQDISDQSADITQPSTTQLVDNDNTSKKEPLTDTGCERPKTMNRRKEYKALKRKRQREQKKLQKALNQGLRFDENSSLTFWEQMPALNKSKPQNIPCEQEVHDTTYYTGSGNRLLTWDELYTQAAQEHLNGPTESTQVNIVSPQDSREPTNSQVGREGDTRDAGEQVDPTYCEQIKQAQSPQLSKWNELSARLKISPPSEQMSASTSSQQIIPSLRQTRLPTRWQQMHAQQSKQIKPQPEISNEIVAPSPSQLENSLIRQERPSNSLEEGNTQIPWQHRHAETLLKHVTAPAGIGDAQIQRQNANFPIPIESKRPNSYAVSLKGDFRGSKKRPIKEERIAPKRKKKKKGVGLPVNVEDEGLMTILVRCSDDSIILNHTDLQAIIEGCEDYMLECNNFQPQVCRTTLFNNEVTIVCKDYETIEWVKYVIPRIPSPTDVPYVTIEPEIPLRKFFVWVPGDREPQKTMALLEKCNSGFITSEVHLIQLIRRNKGISMVFGVEPAMVKWLKDHEYKVHCGMGSVFFRPENLNASRSNDPPIDRSYCPLNEARQMPLPERYELQSLDRYEEDAREQDLYDRRCSYERDWSRESSYDSSKFTREEMVYWNARERSPYP